MRLFDIFIYGTDGNFSRQDVSDLFETSMENVQMSHSSGSQKQLLTFAPDSLDDNTSPYIQCIPESMRLIRAIASSQRKPILRFESESGSGKEIEVKLSMTLAQQSWRQLRTNEETIVEGNNIPPSIVPINSSSIFACCANVLQLQGDRWKSEGLTILPPSKPFLALAMRCIGQSCFPNENIEIPNEEFRNGLVEQFYHTFWSDLGSNLDHSEMAVSIISDLFDSLLSPESTDGKEGDYSITTDVQPIEAGT